MSTIICPNPQCHAQMTSEAQFCMSCGSALQPAQPSHTGEYEDGPADIITTTSEAIRLHPTAPQAYIERGIAYIQKESYHRALADLNYALRLDPTNTLAYGIRGVARSKTGDILGALDDLNYTIKLDRTNAESYFHRGNVHMQLGHSKEAIADYDRVVKIDPNFRNEIYLARAVAFEAQGNTSRAIANIERVLEVTSDPYERSRIENLIAEIKGDRAYLRRHEAGGCLGALLAGLGRGLQEFIRAIFKDL